MATSETVTSGAPTFNPSSLISAVLAMGGGWLPNLDGILSARILGMLIGRNERTIRDQVEELGIPHRRIGSQVFVCVQDYLSAFPVQSSDHREE